MVRESGFDAGPYVMLLDAVIYLRNPLDWDRQVHQVLGSTVADVMGSHHPHSCPVGTSLPAAARLLHDRGTQRLFVLDEQKQAGRGAHPRRRGAGPGGGRLRPP